MRLTATCAYSGCGVARVGLHLQPYPRTAALEYSYVEILV